MRVFALLVKFFILFAITFGIVYGIAPLVLLNVAKNTITKELETFASYTLDRQNYARQCIKAPAASNQSQPLALQLRFLDSQNYAVELICSLVEDTPISISSGILPPTVIKEPGSSGFYLDFNNPRPHSLRLVSLWKTQDISFDGKTVSTSPVAQVPQSSVPRTVCAGAGYQCCMSATQRGEGDAFVGATDCANECYSVCTPLPYILTFSSDPYPETDQRVSLTSETQDVTFSYVADVADSEISQVTISFGDGQEAISTDASGIFTHTYYCPSSCVYEAVIRATDATGNVSVENDLSKLYIERRSL